MNWNNHEPVAAWTELNWNLSTNGKTESNRIAISMLAFGALKEKHTQTRWKPTTKRNMFFYIFSLMQDAVITQNRFFMIYNWMWIAVLERRKTTALISRVSIVELKQVTGLTSIDHALCAHNCICEFKLCWKQGAHLNYCRVWWYWPLLMLSHILVLCGFNDSSLTTRNQSQYLSA